MNPEDCKYYDKEGNEVSPKEYLTGIGPVAYGMRLEGHGVIQILLKGQISTYTFRASNRENFQKIMKNMEKILFEKEV